CRGESSAVPMHDDDPRLRALRKTSRSPATPSYCVDAPASPSSESNTIRVGFVPSTRTLETSLGNRTDDGSPPHPSDVQSFVQSSVSMPLPSSHASPTSTCPSPQIVQLARQVFPLPPAGDPGGSHDSPSPVWTMLSPQNLTGVHAGVWADS